MADRTMDEMDSEKKLCRFVPRNEKLVPRKNYATDRSMQTMAYNMDNVGRSFLASYTTKQIL